MCFQCLVGHDDGEKFLRTSYGYGAKRRETAAIGVMGRKPKLTAKVPVSSPPRGGQTPLLEPRLTTRHPVLGGLPQPPPPGRQQKAISACATSLGPAMARPRRTNSPHRDFQRFWKRIRLNQALILVLLKRRNSSPYVTWRHQWPPSVLLNSSLLHLV